MEMCKTCGTETFGVEDGGFLWCTHCGCRMEDAPKFVVGYCQSHSARNQVYNRRKRFGEYIQRVCKNVSVLRRYYDILDLYAMFELMWVRHPSKRKYFFAKPVMLKVCCRQLKLDVKGLPSLKDRNREVDQENQLRALTQLPMWKSNLKLKHDSKTLHDVEGTFV